MNKSKLLVVAVILLVIGAIAWIFIARKSATFQTYSNDVYGYTISLPSNWNINTQYSNEDFTPRGEEPYQYLGGDTAISNYSEEDIQKYQAQHSVTEFPEDDVLIFFIFEKVDETISLEDYVAKYKLSAEKTDHIMLGDVPAIRYTNTSINIGEDGTSSSAVTVIAKKGDKVLTMDFGYDGKVASLVPIAHKVIESFRFTK